MYTLEQVSAKVVEIIKDLAGPHPFPVTEHTNISDIEMSRDNIGDFAAALSSTFEQDIEVDDVKYCRTPREIAQVIHVGLAFIGKAG